MALSEETKQIVAEKKGELKARLQGLQKEKTEHEASIASINAQIASLTKSINALQTDVAEPVATVAESIVEETIKEP